MERLPDWRERSPWQRLYVSFSLLMNEEYENDLGDVGTEGRRFGVKVLTKT
jgi:hypothetical protein